MINNYYGPVWIVDNDGNTHFTIGIYLDRLPVTENTYHLHGKDQCGDMFPILEGKHKIMEAVRDKILELIRNGEYFIDARAIRTQIEKFKKEE